MSVEETAHRFVVAINRRDADALCDLMTDDHRFVDSLGTIVVGREMMRVGWRTYYTMVPDYTIRIEETFSSGNVVVMTGEAWGTYSPDGTTREVNRWTTPAAWRVVVSGDRVAEWQVFADNDSIRRRMEAEPMLLQPPAVDVV